MERTINDINGNEITISITGKKADVYTTTLCNCLYTAYEAYKEKGLDGTAEEVHNMWEFWYNFSDELELENE